MQKNFAGETLSVQMIPLHLVTTAPQVRTKFNEKSIRELAADIKERGILQPLVVRPKGQGYELMIGERRLRACRYIGATTIPAIVANVNDETKEAAQLIENIQREDLNTKDLSAAVHALWKKHGSVAQTAKVCNKSKSWVSKRLAIAMNVGVLTAQLLDANAKDAELIYAFATLEKADEQKARELLPELLDKNIGRAEVKDALAEIVGGKAKGKAPSPTDDTTGDLFDDPAAKVAEQTAIAQENDTKAIKALRDILHIAALGASKSPLEKWELAREIAREALKEIDGKRPHLH